MLVFEVNASGFAIGGKARKIQALQIGDALNDSREFARALREESRAFGRKLWQSGMDLLKSIHNEENEKLSSIWQTPDAEEFAREKIIPRQNIAELDEESTKISKYAQNRAERLKAKAELRELASGKIEVDNDKD